MLTFIDLRYVSAAKSLCIYLQLYLYCVCDVKQRHPMSNYPRLYLFSPPDWVLANFLHEFFGVPLFLSPGDTHLISTPSSAVCLQWLQRSLHYAHSSTSFLLHSVLCIYLGYRYFPLHLFFQSPCFQTILLTRIS